MAARNRKSMPTGPCLGGCDTPVPRVLDGSEVSRHYEISLPGLWCRACAEVERACIQMRCGTVAELAGVRDVADAFVARIADVLRRAQVEDAERLITCTEALARRARESEVFARYQAGA